MSDLVKKEDILAAYRAWICEREHEQTNSNQLLLERLKSIPTITTKHGKWIKTLSGRPYCSNCGTNLNKDFTEHLKEFIYCPKCGAEMNLK